ncbi:putative Protein kinase [Arthroderma uncinatum]|uniref:putative Protein kinase n=1 Tax=Arthroderma uncinatum TaxID=74035 RepID=UPI00144A95A6|nr:putative Protein kinase [Arthroderma uncinatum]KAF3480776.1 putative Protein kinase [Arthroderma uncinatum]
MAGIYGRLVVPGIERSTLYTFESLFGFVSRGKDGYPGRWKVERILNRLNVLIAGLENLRIDMWCNDAFLSPDAPPGTPPHDSPPTPGSAVWWDSRPLADDGQKWMKIADDVFCINPNTHAVNPVVAVTYSNPTSRIPLLMKICPDTLAEMVRTSIQTDMRHRPRLHIDGISLDSVRDGSLTTTLIHELTHSDFLLGDDVTEDIEGMESAYGWAEAVYIARVSENDALENADNFALFVLAMFLSLNHWGTGVSEKMFDAAPWDLSPP